MQEMQVLSLGQEDCLEEEMATHSSIFAGRIPWIEEAGGLPSMGSQSAGMRAETYFSQHQKRCLWTLSLLRGRVLSTLLRLDVRDL